MVTPSARVIANALVIAQLMLMETTDLQNLFMADAMARAAEVRAGKRLVHYTTAEAAYLILSGKQVWLRHVHLMNDYSEMRHGLTCLQRAWASEAGLTLQQWLDAWPDLRGQLEGLFNAHSDALVQQTYITSLSEHDDDEDEYGRLSMWRAYGGKAGVALILNTAPFLAETDAMKVFSAPVAYRSEDDFIAWFASWSSAIMAEPRMLQVPRETVLHWFYWSFRLIVLATKHPGFREEREWRIFHSPSLDGQSPWLELDTAIVGGVPQPIVKLKLEDDESIGVTGVAPSGLVNRVIIGPCESPLPVRAAIGAALASAGVEGIEQKVSMSFIPLRQRV